jgi:hypothetical protein
MISIIELMMIFINSYIYHYIEFMRIALSIYYFFYMLNIVIPIQNDYHDYNYNYNNTDINEWETLLIEWI